MDVPGGCSKEVEQNIKELVGDKCESIMRQMQKAILSSSLHIARMFNLILNLVHYRNVIDTP